MKESNVPIRETVHVDENELAAGEQGKLPFKRLR